MAIIQKVMTSHQYFVLKEQCVHLYMVEDGRPNWYCSRNEDTEPELVSPTPLDPSGTSASAHVCDPKHSEMQLTGYLDAETRLTVQLGERWGQGNNFNVKWEYSGWTTVVDDRSIWN